MWRDFLGNLSGYKQKSERCSADYAQCHDTVVGLREELDIARRQLELLVPRPAPLPVTYEVERSAAWVKDTLAKLGVVWLQLDRKYYLTDQTNFLNIVAWDWTDSYTYIRDKWDCDKFTVRFKSQVDLHFGLNQVGIVIDYGSGHAYNLIIYPDGNIMLLEPMSDALFCWTKRIKMFYPLEGAYVLL